MPPSKELFEESKRVLTVCSVCRYCEGYCAVFTAMKLRNDFSPADVKYLANLCFDCRDCFYACQYSPPHEFNINVPKMFTEVRSETYKEFSWPKRLGYVFEKNWQATSLFVLFSFLFLLISTVVVNGGATLTTQFNGPGAFYKVVPHTTMIALFSGLGLLALVVLLIGVVGFWKAIEPQKKKGFFLSGIVQAAKDAAKLRYLHGGGEGCAYPGADFSSSRRVFHHFVVLGFVLDFVSTTIAAFYDHFLKWSAPYPILSLPVVFGFFGGVGIVIGTTGLLVLKHRSNNKLATREMFKLDVVFLALLFGSAVTGLLLLALRETAAMGLMLILHLSLVAGLFFAIPYGKFVHIGYRLVALFRHAVEQLELLRQRSGKSSKVS